MEPNGHSSSSFYTYLIRPDKSATPQLEDLCLGLAKIIKDIDPGRHPDNELTPQRLAAFYRRLGGNYDSLFLKTSDDGLSFMYRTLGCFHSLQPTRSPFETPRIPCLTPAGFARWQTIQILLCPNDHVPFLQKAVQTFDVPRPDGGYFPKHLPRECLPDRPDEAMEKWYKHVTGSLNQDNYMRRLKYSPAQSPYLEPQDRRDSYFQNGQSRLARTTSQDEEQARLAAYRRRSSVPDIPSPLPTGAERGSHWDPAAPQQRKARSHSATRPTYHVRQRSHTTSTPDRPNPRKSDSPTSRRYGNNPTESNSRPSSQQYSHQRQRPSGGRPKSSSTLDQDTGSEASSETSQNGRHSRQRKSDEERVSRKNLWVPSFLRPTANKRRHSSDAGVRKIEAAKPPIPEYYGPKRQHVAPPIMAPPVMPPSHRPPPNGVRFRDDIFDDSMHSAPETPLQPAPGAMPPPAIRYPEPQPAYPTHQMEGMSMVGPTQSRESSSGSSTDRRSHSDWDRDAQRKAGAPLRVATVTGVGGRKYASAEPKSVDRQPTRLPRASVPAAVI